jgi:predicted PurR-regulated permease PerM
MPADDSTPLLSPAQRRLVGATLTASSVVGLLALVYFALVVVGGFVSRFSNVIWPLAVAGILALVLRPVVALFERRFKIRRPAAVVLLYALVLLALAALLFAIVPAVVAQLIEFANYLPTLWEHTRTWTEKHFPQWLVFAQHYWEKPEVKNAVLNLARQAQELAAQIVPSLGRAGAGLFGLFGTAAALAVVPVYLFFFLLSDDDPADQLPEHLTFLRDSQRDDVIFLVREFLGILVAFFRGQLLICLVLGALYGTGFSLTGLKFGLAIGLGIGLLNIVPYLGSILGLCVALPLALFQPDGGLGLLGAVLAVFVAVQALDGWMITPRIMGQQTGLHPVAIIVAVFFWGKAFGGILGMMLAVPLTAFFVTAWRLVRRKYFTSEPAKDHPKQPGS